MYFTFNTVEEVSNQDPLKSGLLLNDLIYSEEAQIISV